jgi:hypothetical protein
MTDSSSGLITVLLRLPLLFNPDPTGARALIEDEKFLQTAEEIAQQFGGGTLFRFPSDAPRGFWWDQGIMHQDVLALIEVDVPDTEESRTWLRAYAREVLLQRFHQRAIYLKFVRRVEQLIISEEEIDDEG